MKKLTLLFVFTLYSIVSLAGNQIDSLLNVLDKTIKESKSYVEARENRINSLKKRLNNSTLSPEQIYSINKLLYKEYRTFVCDSAIHYLNNNLEIAETSKNKGLINETKLFLSHLHSSSGMYRESSDILYSINKNQLTKDLIPYYYKCYEHLYNEMYLYTHDQKLKKNYFKLFQTYQDTLLTVFDPSSENYLAIKEQKALEQKNLVEARKINSLRLSKAPFGTPEYALITFQVSLIDREEKKLEDEKKHLIFSAMSDIKAAIKDNASLSNLANLLYEEGDIDRAYQYIKYSLEDANFYNARLRNIQISNTLPIIEKSYQIKSEKQKNELKTSLICISALALLLFGALGYIYKQMKRLSKARNELGVINNQLKSLNNELAEANHIKEEYIAHFLGICSTYIDKLESYRKMVNKKINGGQVTELLKITKSSEVLESELKDFYVNFDNTFLHLYPKFVEEFNNLLVKEERIVLKKGELLNTELRIFALIRLGIDDSSKIANLLRYSVNTIYNYRAKVKNKALGSRDDFESLVMRIGAFS
nr:DUF6377 domain-containing protein [uncultured Bacteroides sp.]